jgi:hypothetical protein
MKVAVLPRRTLGTLAALCLTPLPPGGPLARAQSYARPAAASESLQVLRRARGAQRDFEWTRRINLPFEHETGAGRCDERIGRYCYWYQPYSSPAPRESDAIVRARERLLRRLMTAGERVPGDGWIVGQLVRYLAEQGEMEFAISTAQRCRTTRWWCDALEGFARHVVHDYEGSEAAFGRALSEMPKGERCTWNDLTPLLEQGRRRYRALSCAERQELDERIWWLARPLYSRPGNDLRTEHYARHTMALLLQDAETPDGVPFGEDTRELVVRYGWPVHWSRGYDRPGRLEQPPIYGHEPSPSFWLFPQPTLTEPWADVTQLQWDPELKRPNARHPLSYAAGFAPIRRVQFARFLRGAGDSTLTVAAFDLSADSVFSIRQADARLAVARDPSTPVEIEEISPVGPRGVLMVRSPWRPAVLSLEALGMSLPWAARARTMAHPDPAGVPPALSDILLFAPSAVMPGSLENALTLALTAPVVRAGQRVGLYWEMYDEPDSSASVQIAVTVVKAKSKGDAVYPAGRPWCPYQTESPVRLRWWERPSGRPGSPARAVTLDLHSLSRGRYLVSVQATVGERPRACSSREFWVR